EMLAVLLDTDPEARPGPPPVTWHPDAVPSDLSLLRRTAFAYMRRPEKVIRLSVRSLRELARTTGSRGVAAMADIVAQPLPGRAGNVIRRRLREDYGREVDNPPPLPPTPAPKTPWNRTISAHRRF